MKKGNLYSTIIYIVISIFLCLSLAFFIPNNRVLYYSDINPIFWFTLFVISYLWFKNDICKKRYKYDFLQIVTICVIVYLIIFFLFGLIVGYNDLPYNHSILGILKNIWSYVIIILFQEYIRQALINRSGKNKLLLIIITCIFAFIGIINLSYGMNIVSLEDGFKLVFTIIVSEVAKSALLTYLTYNSDFIPSFLYAFLLQLIIYVIPITPNLNWFLDATFKLLLPFSVYILCNNFYIKKEKERSRKRKVTISLMPLIIVIIPVIFLVSGVFKYQAIAVISNSMKPSFKRGDAVVFEKISNIEKNDLEKGTIIVFKSDKYLILHRIEEIKYTDAGNKIYITKGDNNNGIDDGYITDKDIIGIYKFRMPKLGYPSVWLQELIKE